jgi:cysteine-rich repeat protein
VRVPVVGTIDPATGAFDVRGALRNEPCGGFDSLMGTATALVYASAGSVKRQFGICQERTWNEAGGRCGNGAVGLGEACDDGNQINGDGCSACVTDVCWTCTGSPSVCTIGPRPTCKPSTVPAKSRLRIRNDPAHAKFKFLWKWKNGADTALSELGNPVGYDAYTLCVFDMSTPTPALLFRAAMPPGGTCGSSPCWSANGSRGFTFKNRTSAPEGMTNLRVESGNGGSAQALVKGKGLLLSNRPFGLPSPPLPHPLRVQLQGAAGFCAETDHDAPSTRTNSPTHGLFMSRGAP